jgi:hypothetical protein
MGALGSAVGAIAGAAVGGTGRSTAGGAALGAIAGGLLGARLQRTNRVDSSEVRRDISICKIMKQAVDRRDKTVVQMLQALSSYSCGLSLVDFRANGSQATNKVNYCVQGKSAGEKTLQKYVATIFALNHEACLSAQSVNASWSASQAGKKNGLLAADELCPLQAVQPDRQAPPSVLTLAKLSQYTYEIGEPLPFARNDDDMEVVIDGYKREGTPIRDVNFAAAVFVSGERVIIAFRGTQDFSDTLAFFTDWLTNASWLAGVADDFLIPRVNKAARLLANTYARHPNSKMYLTGHSLGGAIADIVAIRASLPAVTFNAPGVAEVIRNVGSQDLDSLDSIRFTNKGRTVDYKVLGDRIFGAGTHVGGACTIFQDNPGDSIIDIRRNHKMQLAIELLETNMPVAPGNIQVGAEFPVGFRCSVSE